MDIKIRKAGHSDLETLKKFQAELVKFERPFDHTIKKGNVEYYNIPNKINSDKVRFLIAEYNKKPVGCGIGQIMKNVKWSKYKYKGYLGLMFVDEEFRGKGISKMIMKDIIKWFSKNKIKDIMLQVYAENTAAVKAYEKAGFKTQILEMKLNIDK